VVEFVVEFGQDGRPVESDGRLDAAAFHRNHQAISAVLRQFLDGRSGDAVEAGSGTGQHVVEFARQNPGVTWWPSDLNAAHLRSIEAWRAASGLPNLRSALRIDLSDPAWCPEMHDGHGPEKLLAVFCANVIHIAPWRVAEGLLEGAGRYLRADGRLLLYGPFQRDGRHSADSNAAFDRSLRQANAEWGVRDITVLQQRAADAGLELIETVEMPANNLMLAFERRKQD
jgi:SAM-dependent methyltransferase